jgi:hypothetical protein
VKMTQGERIAVLETQMRTVQAGFDEMKKSQDEMLQQQQKILLALTKNKGMWGGIVLTVSGVFTVLTMAKDGIMSFIAGLFQ